MSVRDDIIEMVPMLRAYAMVLTRNRQEVDDLVQETLLKAIARIDSFQPGTNLRGWLMAIMRNTFFNNIKRASRMRTGTEDCVSFAPSVPATQEWTVRGNELMQAVARLPVHYCEMLILVVMLGESYESAAEKCGVAIGTVKSRVNRARAMVVEDLESEGANSPNAPSSARRIPKTRRMAQQAAPAFRPKAHRDSSLPR